MGVSGEANLRVWAPKGVAITTHDALVPDYAKDLERPGFSSLLPDSGKQHQSSAGGSGSGGAKGKSGGGKKGGSGGGGKKGKR